MQAAIAELGFVRNESARHLRSGASRAVGLVVIDAANPFFSDVARGVEDTVQAAGGVVLLGNSAGDIERENRYLELFEQQRVRGVLIAPTATGAAAGLAGPPRIPVVFLDRYPEDADCSSVSVDDVAGGCLAVRHLLERGHRALAFVGGPSTLRQVRDRRQGAEETIATTPDATLLAVSTPALTIPAGRQAGEELAALPEAQRPTAVFAANDLVALGVLAGLTDQGLRVPEDVAIVGYDDIEFAAAAAVPLSSVRQPRAELGRRGAGCCSRRSAGVRPVSPGSAARCASSASSSYAARPHRPCDAGGAARCRAAGQAGAPVRAAAPVRAGAPRPAARPCAPGRAREVLAVVPQVAPDREVVGRSVPRPRRRTTRT